MPDNKVLRLIAVVGVFTSPVLGGAILGYYLDEYFKTAPAFAVGLIVVGFATGIYNLIKLLSAYTRETRK